MFDFTKAYGLESNYLSAKRLASYQHQITSVLELRPSEVLEVGKGPGLVAGALRAVGVELVTLDFRPELQPDLVGSVLDIPAADRSHDLTMCCQVLEHLPFSDFPKALDELRRVSRRALVLSLPDATRHFYLRARLPLLKNVSWDCSLPRHRTGPPKTPGHHWEIGYPGSSLRDVTAAIQASGWRLERTWRVPEHSWHRFFLLRRADGEG